MQANLFRIFADTILIIMLLAGAITVLSLSRIPGGFRLFTVMSGSMEPRLHTGSIILTKAQSDYSTNDIVTRATDEQSVTITHRIISKEITDGNAYFETKGDANDSADGEKFPQSLIIGKVFLTVPYVGYVATFAKTPLGIISIIVIPAAIIIYEEFGKIFNEIRRISKNKANKKEAAREENEQTI